MVGLWQMDVVATRLEPAEAAEELLKYWRHKPLLFKYMIIPLLGYKGDPSEKDVRALAEHVPIFSLTGSPFAGSFCMLQRPWCPLMCHLQSIIRVVPEAGDRKSVV